MPLLLPAAEAFRRVVDVAEDVAEGEAVVAVVGDVAVEEVAAEVAAKVYHLALCIRQCPCYITFRPSMCGRFNHSL